MAVVVVKKTEAQAERADAQSERKPDIARKTVEIETKSPLVECEAPDAAEAARPQQNVHRRRGVDDLKTKAEPSVGKTPVSSERSPTEPLPFEVTPDSTLTDQALRSQANQGSIREAQSLIAERPPRSVYDKLIDVRDWLRSLTSRLLQVEQSEANVVPDTLPMTGGATGNTPVASQLSEQHTKPQLAQRADAIRAEIASLKNSA